MSRDVGVELSVTFCKYNALPFSLLPMGQIRDLVNQHRYHPEFIATSQSHSKHVSALLHYHRAIFFRILGLKVQDIPEYHREAFKTFTRPGGSAEEVSIAPWPRQALPL